MIRVKRMLAILFTLAFFSTSAQRIVYSDYDKDDTRRLNFEIAGKIGGNFLIYKNIHNKSWIAVLDNEMQQIAKVEQDYVPDNDRMINVDFFAYGDFCYMIYEYQKKNIVHCSAVKIDGNGKKVGDVMELDTTQINFAANNKIYTVLSSEDKGKIIVFKINNKNRKNFLISTLLMDNKLNVLKKSRLGLPMEDRDDDFLNQFQLDNDGDLIFTKYNRVNSESIGEASFVIKYADADTLDIHHLNLDKTFLDEIHIKPDNYNKRYFLTSFFYKQRRGNTDGYYFYIWDKAARQVVMEDTIVFTDDLRKEAKGNSNAKMAFNDYFIRNILTKRDGGFVIGSEAYYTTSRGNTWNRYNYLYGYPYMRPVDYYYYSPYYSSWSNSRFYDNNAMNVRYQADNIVVMSFDKNGRKEWASVITKEQYDDQTDDMISYQVMNTGGQVHVLFNNMEKRTQLLDDFTLTPDGKITHNPTLHNLDKGYEFMPKYGKQVSAKQIIMPCLYRNFVCFAKIDYN